MKIELNLPDDLAEVYSEMPSLRRNISLADKLVSQLKRFQKCNLTDSHIVVGPEARVILERKLGIAAITNAAQLVEAIEKQCEIQISGVSLELSPAEKREIVVFAERNRMKPEDELKRRVDFIKPLIFNSARGL